MQPKAIGLIGGMDSLATTHYNQIINECYLGLFEGKQSPSVITHSINIDKVRKAVYRSEWESVERVIDKAFMDLINSGAELIALCDDTLHRCIPNIILHGQVEFLHLVDTLAEYLRERNVSSIGLFATRSIYEDQGFCDILSHYGIDVVQPDEEDTILLNEIIFRELLTVGSTKGFTGHFQYALDSMEEQGVNAIVLTSSGMNDLVTREMTDLRIVDTTAVHARAIAVKSLGIKNHQIGKMIGRIPSNLNGKN